MIEKTLDPDIVIIDRDIDLIHYQSISTGRVWSVVGKCNQCGLCVVGAYYNEHYIWYKEAGQPYAVTDIRVSWGRLDEPITPEFPFINNGCSLKIGK
jgi:hypothetical protein